MPTYADALGSSHGVPVLAKKIEQIVREIKGIFSPGRGAGARDPGRNSVLSAGFFTLWSDILTSGGCGRLPRRSNGSEGECWKKTSTHAAAAMAAPPGLIVHVW